MTIFSGPIECSTTGPERCNPRLFTAVNSEVESLRFVAFPQQLSTFILLLICFSRNAIHTKDLDDSTQSQYFKILSGLVNA